MLFVLAGYNRVPWYTTGAKFTGAPDKQNFGFPIYIYIYIYLNMEYKCCLCMLN